jgi:hypothetical protein
MTKRQLDGLIALALDSDAPEDERVQAGHVALEEIHRLERKGFLHPHRWDMLDAMTGDFWWLDRQRRFS